MDTISVGGLLLLSSTHVCAIRCGRLKLVIPVNSQPLAVTEDRLEVSGYPLPVNLLTGNVLQSYDVTCCLRERVDIT